MRLDDGAAAAAVRCRPTRPHNGEPLRARACSNTIKETESVAALINKLRIPLAASSAAAGSQTGDAREGAASAAAVMRAGVYHGQLPAAERMATHRAFVRDEINVVVATTGACARACVLAGAHARRRACVERSIPAADPPLHSWLAPRCMQRSAWGSTSATCAW